MTLIEKKNWLLFLWAQNDKNINLSNYELMTVTVAPLLIFDSLKILFFKIRFSVTVKLRERYGGLPYISYLHSYIASFFINIPHQSGLSIPYSWGAYTNVSSRVPSLC